MWENITQKNESHRIPELHSTTDERISLSKNERIDSISTGITKTKEKIKYKIQFQRIEQNQKHHKINELMRVKMHTLELHRESLEAIPYQDRETRRESATLREST